MSHSTHVIMDVNGYFSRCRERPTASFDDRQATHRRPSARIFDNASDGCATGYTRAAWALHIWSEPRRDPGINSACMVEHRIFGSAWPEPQGGGRHGRGRWTPPVGVRGDRRRPASESRGIGARGTFHYGCRSLRARHSAAGVLVAGASLAQPVSARLRRLPREATSAAPARSTSSSRTRPTRRSHPVRLARRARSGDVFPRAREVRAGRRRIAVPGEFPDGHGRGRPEHPGHADRRDGDRRGSSIGLDEIVVKGSRNVEFFYTVNGVRKAHKDSPPIGDAKTAGVHAVESADATMPAYHRERKRC